MLNQGMNHRFKELSELSSYLQRLLETRLWAKIIFGMLLGIVLGLLLAPRTGLVSEETAGSISVWLGFPGMLFMKLVQMIMIPLIFSSIIIGLASNTDKEKPREAKGHGHPKRARQLRNKSK